MSIHKNSDFAPWPPKTFDLLRSRLNGSKLEILSDAVLGVSHLSVASLPGFLAASATTWAGAPPVVSLTAAGAGLMFGLGVGLGRPWGFGEGARLATWIDSAKWVRDEDILEYVESSRYKGETFVDTTVRNGKFAMLNDRLQGYYVNKCVEDCTSIPWEGLRLSSLLPPLNFGNGLVCPFASLLQSSSVIPEDLYNNITDAQAIKVLSLGALTKTADRVPQYLFSEKNVLAEMPSTFAKELEKIESLTAGVLGTSVLVSFVMLGGLRHIPSGVRDACFPNLLGCKGKLSPTIRNNSSLKKLAEDNVEVACLTHALMNDELDAVPASWLNGKNFSKLLPSIATGGLLQRVPISVLLSGLSEKDENGKSVLELAALAGKFTQLDKLLDKPLPSECRLQVGEEWWAQHLRVLDAGLEVEDRVPDSQEIDIF